MDTAQSLQSPKEMVERISGAMTLSCTQYTLLKSVVRHTVLMMFSNSFKVPSSCSPFQAFPQLPLQRSWEVNFQVGQLSVPLHSQLSVPLHSCSNNSGQGQRQSMWELNQSFPSCRKAFGRLCLGSCTRGIFYPISFYIVLLPERSKREGKSFFCLKTSLHLITFH